MWGPRCLLTLGSPWQVTGIASPFFVYLSTLFQLHILYSVQGEDGFVRDKLLRMHEDAIVAYPRIWPEELRKDTEDKLSPGQNLELRNPRVISNIRYIFRNPHFLVFFSSIEFVLSWRPCVIQTQRRSTRFTSR